MTRGNRLTNEELEEIRERAELFEKEPWTVVGYVQHAREDIPKLLAEVEFRREQQAMLLEYNRRYLANLKRMSTEIERLEDRLRDVEILYNECSTELDSFY